MHEDYLAGLITGLVGGAFIGFCAAYMATKNAVSQTTLAIKQRNLRDDTDREFYDNADWWKQS